MNDGGPAFPRPKADSGFSPGQEGMSLREYYVGQVLAGWNNTYEVLAVRLAGLDPEARDTIAPPPAIVRLAFQIADEAIESGGKGGTTGRDRG